MITRVVSLRQATMSYVFDNGNEVSIVFGPYTYSDNHDAMLTLPLGLLESKTVEIMVFGEMVAWFERKYGDNPGGYIPVSEIPAILKRADRRLWPHFGLNNASEGKKAASKPNLDTPEEGKE